MTTGKGTKWTARKTAGQAHHSLLKTAERLVVLRDIFKKDHPDDAAQLDELGIGVMMLMQALEKFAEKAWGDSPESLEAIIYK